MDVIKTWFISNGTVLNSIYIGVFLFVLLSFFMAIKTDSTPSKKSHADSIDTGIAVFIIASILPSLLYFCIPLTVWGTTTNC